MCTLCTAVSCKCLEVMILEAPVMFECQSCADDTMQPVSELRFKYLISKTFNTNISFGFFCSRASPRRAF